MDIQMTWDLLSTMRQQRKRDEWSCQQLDAHQANALRSLREYASAHAPFCQRFHRGLVGAPLYELPVLTKATMMEHFDELVTDRAIRLAASEPLESIIQQLNAWQPEMLIAYASMAPILADEQLAGRLEIRPRAVFTNPEVLTQETRRRIVQTWGERLFN